MMVEGEEIINEKLIRGHIDFYFKELFGQLVAHRLNMVSDFWLEKFDLSTTSVQFLKEEIIKAIWGLNLYKSSGPNDFPILLYRIFWDMIKGEFVNLFEEIYQLRQSWKDSITPK